MKKFIVPKDTRYIPFTQQNSCCVPTSIIMVMYKLGIPLISQELLGYHLGLILDKKYKKLFWNVRTGKRPAAGYGTRVYDKKYDLNFVFKKLKIPLEVKEYSISCFKNNTEVVSFIDKKIKKNSDLVVLLGSDVLNKTNKKSGHACVVDKIYPSRNIVRIIDPSANRAKWREITINKLITAMEFHPTGGGRFIEFIKNN